MGQKKSGELVDKQREDENHKTVPLPRTVIDRNVSDRMADYWTTFACHRTPNGIDKGRPGGEGLNIVIEKGDAPLWVTVTGIEQTRNQTFNKSKAKDYAGYDEDTYRLHLYHADELQRKMRIKAQTVKRIFSHQLVFDEEPSMHIIGDDCYCGFWNSLGYKF